MRKVVVLAFAVSASSVCLSGAAVTLEQFNVDAAGFGPNTISSVVAYSGAGGNPGGFIQTRRDLGQPFFDIGALVSTPAFTGDFQADGIGSATVDLNFQTTNVSGAYLRFRMNAATNGWLFPLTAIFPANVWNTYGVVFNPFWSDVQARAAGWITDEDLDPAANPSPAFATVLGSVGSTEIRIASSFESTLVGIDNVGLGVHTPEPSSLLLLAPGLAIIALKRRLGKRNGKVA